MTMRRLFRSKKERVLGGVAGGLAEYFEVDVVLVRLLWVLAAFVGGGGILAYIVAWIIIPEEETIPKKARPVPGEKKEVDGKQETVNSETGESQATQGEEGTEDDNVQDAVKYAEQDTGQAVQEHKARRQRNAGLLLIGLGLIFLSRQVLPAYFFQFSWPLLLILLGLFFLMRDRRETE